MSPTKRIIGHSSLTLALIFFLVGHMIIAMTVVSIITGARIWEAGAVAVMNRNKFSMVLRVT